MKRGYLWKKCLILVMAIVFFVVWLIQEHSIANRPTEQYLSDVGRETLFQHGATFSSLRPRLPVKHNGSYARTTKHRQDELKLVSSSHTKHMRDYSAMVTEYTVDIPVRRITTKSVASLNMNRVENNRLDTVHERKSDDYLKPSSKHISKLGSPFTLASANVKHQQSVEVKQDYDSKDNSFFIVNLANISFVEVQVSSKAESGKGMHANSAIRRRHLWPTSTQSSSQNVASRSKTVGFETARVISAHDDEMENFAKLPELPDYDLPLLKASDAISVVSNNSKSTEQIFAWPPVGLNSSEELLNKIPLSSDSNAGDDDIMTAAIVLGDINVDKMYAVFSTTTDNREAVGFIFLLPLTVLAWKRIGFESIIVIVGSVDSWNSNDLFHLVLSSVRELGAVVIFLEPRPEKSVMISQVSRIFVANILRARAAFVNSQQPDIIDNVFIITTDADIWPLYGAAYRLPRGKTILSLNSECCGAFSHRGSTYRMLPMANIGMNIGTWRLLTRRFGESPQSVDDILTYVVREFGPVALRPVHKGDNVGWFIDQMMVSLLVATWIENNNNATDTVKFIPRDVGVDRIDRNSWNPGGGVTVDDKIDAHLLVNAHLPGTWVQLVPLIRAMYGEETDRYVWSMRYYDNFQRLFLAQFQKVELDIDDDNVH